MDFILHNFAPIMFGGLIAFLLMGFPVAFSLGACGLFFGFLGIQRCVRADLAAALRAHDVAALQQYRSPCSSVSSASSSVFCRQP